LSGLGASSNGVDGVKKIIAVLVGLISAILVGVANFGY
jgi:hypothetical protein